jgi:hypothetical protein
MARPKKIPQAIEHSAFEGLEMEHFDAYAPSTFAQTLRAVDKGEIEQAAKNLLRKAHDGDDWAISLVADLLRENNDLV